MASRKHCRKKIPIAKCIHQKEKSTLDARLGQKILGRKLYPVAKFKRCKLWVSGQKVPYLQCRKQVYISLGVKVIIGFISSTSDEETF